MVMKSISYNDSYEYDIDPPAPKHSKKYVYWKIEIVASHKKS